MFRAAVDRPDPPDLSEVASAIHNALKAAQEKSPLLRSMATTFSARAHAVVVLDKKRTNREGHNPARHFSFESHLKAGTIPATLFES
jgi:hypothetical protein